MSEGGSSVKVNIMVDSKESLWNKTSCNRLRVITKDGVVKFGSLYNISPQEYPTLRTIPIQECTAKCPVRKSESGKKNQQKICSKGDTVGIIGDYNVIDNPEVFIYKDGDPVYKRRWADVKDKLENFRTVNKTLAALAYGYYRKEDLCFMVKLHRGDNADVWISERWWRKNNTEPLMMDDTFDTPNFDLPEKTETDPDPSEKTSN